MPLGIGVTDGLVEGRGGTSSARTPDGITGPSWGGERVDPSEIGPRADRVELRDVHPRRWRHVHTVRIKRRHSLNRPSAPTPSGEALETRDRGVR